MTEEQHAQYRRELNTRYSPEELKLHSQDRTAKSILEIIHAQNFFLIGLVGKWRAYVEGRGPKPSRNLWHVLQPGSNQQNTTCEMLRQLVEFYSEYEYGQAQDLPIAYFCSRSTLELLATMEDFYFTPHLDTAASAAKDFFTLITSSSLAPYTHEQFKKALEKSAEDFISACAENSKLLHAYILKYIQGAKTSTPATADDVERIVKTEHAETRGVVKDEAAISHIREEVALTSLTTIKATTTQINNRGKRDNKRAKAKFDRATLDKIWTIWQGGRKNPNIRNTSNTKIGYDEVFNYYRIEFTALGVKNAEMLAKTIKSRNNILSRERQGK